MANSVEKRATVRGMFNRIAPTYDLLNHLLSFGIDRRWRKATIQLLKLRRDSVLLDLACGTGDLSEEATKHEVRTIFAVDPSRQMLHRAEAKLRYNTTRCYFLESFGEELPLKDNLCSHAMIAFGIRNVAERNYAFKEIYRVLKPGGYFAILEFTPMEKKIPAFFFNIYFQKILPSIGALISRDKEAYKYLPESVERFVTAQDLIRECESVGFTTVETRAFSLGVATCILFQKSAGGVFLNVNK